MFVEGTFILSEASRLLEAHASLHLQRSGGGFSSPSLKAGHNNNWCPLSDTKFVNIQRHWVILKMEMTDDMPDVTVGRFVSVQLKSNVGSEFFLCKHILVLLYVKHFGSHRSDMLCK